MVDLRGEVHLWRLERVVGWEVDVQEEHAASVGTVRWAHDGRLPVEHVVSNWPRRAIRRRVVPKVL